MIDVLIISKNHDLRSSISKAIEVEGGKPHIAISIETAIEVIREVSPPLILLEDGIGDSGAKETVSRLRDSFSTREPRILALVDDPFASKRELLNAGYDDLIRIPFDLSDLALLLHSAHRFAQKSTDVLPNPEAVDATLLRQLSLDLAWSTTLEQQAAYGLNAACKLLGVERGAVWVRDSSDRMLRCATQVGLSDEYSALGASSLNFLGQEEWVELSRRPEFDPRADEWTGASADLAAQEGISSSLTAALFTPSNVIGALILYDLPGVDEDLGEECIQLVETITAITAMAIDQTGLRDDLSNSEATYRQLVEEMPHGVFVHDSQGNFLMSNSAIASICGYNEGDLALMSLFDLIEGGVDGRDGQLVTEVLTEITNQKTDMLDFTEMFGPYSLHLAAADGRSVEAEVYFRPLKLKGRTGEIWIQAMARDITNEARALRELVALRAVAENLTGIDDEFKALRKVLGEIKNSIPFLHASVWRLSPNHRELICSAQAGIEFPNLLADPESGLYGETLASNATHHLTDLEAEENANPVHKLVAEIATIPVQANGVAVGLLQVQTGADRQLSAGDIDFLESVSAQIAGRIERMELLNQIHQLKALDPTTGLDNRRTFHERLAQIVDRADGEPVSVLHIGVDGFKLLNDAYGHVVGDEILQQIGETIKGHLDPPYHLARYGGDEFCAILPGVSRSDISNLADRVRIGVATQLFQAEEQLEHITVSIGAATLPDDADDCATLVTAAADATYMAKQAGRNQVYQSNAALGELSMKQTHLIESLRRNPQKTLALLVRAMDQRLPERSGHAARVARLALTLGAEAGIEGDALNHLGISAYIHDIGMFLIPDELLRKPVDLTNEEREKLAIVPAVAHRLLSQVKLPASVNLAVLHQYERWDGSGYPGGLSGESIPLEARIIAVADALDAMTSPRAHRDQMSMADAIEALWASAEKRFDPDIVATAERLLSGESFELTEVKTTALDASLDAIGVN